MFKSKKLAVLAALLSLLMLFSLMTVSAFAEEVTTGNEEQTTVAPETEAGTEAGTEADSKDETTAESKEETTTEAKKEEQTTAASGESAEAKKERMTRSIINLSVGAVLLIVVIVLAIKFRAKIPSWFKGLKSECGKITWCPKDKLKKNVFVVVVIIVAIAVAIGVLDFVFSRGMILLGDLFN